MDQMKLTPKQHSLVTRITRLHAKYLKEEFKDREIDTREYVVNHMLPCLYYFAHLAGNMKFGLETQGVECNLSELAKNFSEDLLIASQEAYNLKKSQVVQH